VNAERRPGETREVRGPGAKIKSPLSYHTARKRKERGIDDAKPGRKAVRPLTAKTGVRVP